MTDPLETVRAPIPTAWVLVPSPTTAAFPMWELRPFYVRLTRQGTDSKGES